MMRRALLIVFFLLAVAARAVAAGDARPAIMTSDDLAAFPEPTPDARIPYGDDPLQFADLRLPEGEGPFPVMILIHGGCWLSEWNIQHIGKFASAFARHGIATWAVEYRRVGDSGGGWPGTFQDISRSAARMLDIAGEYALDTSRVIVAGHSAGGQLALWLAAGSRPGDTTLFASAQRVNLKGVLALAPAPDLETLHEQGVCDNVVDKLMGGSPAEFPERYALGSPMDLLPIGLPQIVVIGAFDDNWGPGGRSYLAAAKAAHDPIRLIEAPQSGHFEMIDPDSSTWPLVLHAAYELLGMPEIGR